jgi:hypothetical protein
MMQSITHGYMPNPGYPHVRKAVADHLNKEFGVGLTPDLVVMTAGSGRCAERLPPGPDQPGRRDSSRQPPILWDTTSMRS